MARTGHYSGNMAKLSQKKKETDDKGRAWAGNTTKCMSRSHIFSYSSTSTVRSERMGQD